MHSTEYLLDFTREAEELKVKIVETIEEANERDSRKIIYACLIIAATFYKNTITQEEGGEDPLFAFLDGCYVSWYAARSLEKGEEDEE